MALSVTSVVAFTRFQHHKAENQSYLKNLAAVVLKNIWYPMLRCQLLVLADCRKQVFQELNIRMRCHFDASSSSLLGVVPNAAASLAMLSIEMFRSLRTIDPT